MRATRKAPPTTAQAMKATFPRPMRRPKKPFTIAPKSGRRMMSQRLPAAAWGLFRKFIAGFSKSRRINPFSATEATKFRANSGASVEAVTDAAHRLDAGSVVTDHAAKAEHE